MLFCGTDHRSSWSVAPASPCYTPFMPEPRDVPDEPPPFLGSWKRVYIATLLYLGVILLGFYIFTRAFQ
jgi:hypothetical protein